MPVNEPICGCGGLHGVDEPVTHPGWVGAGAFYGEGLGLRGADVGGGDVEVGDLCCEGLGGVAGSRGEARGGEVAEHGDGVDAAAPDYLLIADCDLRCGWRGLAFGVTAVVVGAAGFHAGVETDARGAGGVGEDFAVGGGGAEGVVGCWGGAGVEG